MEYPIGLASQDIDNLIEDKSVNSTEFAPFSLRQ
jgi:hypothetical protein